MLSLACSRGACGRRSAGALRKAPSACAERGRPRLLLVELPQQDVAAGGGGPISNEELWAALQLSRGDDGGRVELRVRPQSVIHTDSARAYFNLGLREADLPPRNADRAANPGEGPAQQAARFAAEAAEGLRPPASEDDLPLAILAER